MPADMKSGASDPRPSGERDKALNLVLGQIERNFGKGSIMRLGDASRMRVETISTGALTLDLALGGGYPKGRVVEIYGPESPVRPPSPCMPLLRCRSVVVLPLSSTLSMPWIRFTPRPSALTWKTCWCPSRTPVRWRWRSLTSWSAPRRWTSL